MESRREKQKQKGILICSGTNPVIPLFLERRASHPIRSQSALFRRHGIASKWHQGEQMRSSLGENHRGSFPGELSNMRMERGGSGIINGNSTTTVKWNKSNNVEEREKYEMTFEMRRHSKE